MKNIVMKSVFALLLIIEFYPIESNSQTATESKDCYMYNSGEEMVGEYSENPGVQPEFRMVMEIFIDKSTTDIDNQDSNFDNVNSTEANGDLSIDSENVLEFNRIEVVIPAEYYYYQSSENGITPVVKLVMQKY